MKSIVLLFVCCTLLSSCYSYKAMEFSKENIVVGNRYLIDTKDKREIKGTVQAVNETGLTMAKTGKTVEVPYSNIDNIESSDFSEIGTVGLIVLVSAVAVIIVALLDWAGL